MPEYLDTYLEFEDVASAILTHGIPFSETYFIIGLGDAPLLISHISSILIFFHSLQLISDSSKLLSYLLFQLP